MSIQTIRHAGSSVQPEQSRPSLRDKSGSVSEHNVGKSRRWCDGRETLEEKGSVNKEGAAFEEESYREAEHVLQVAIEQAEEIGFLNPRLADSLNELGMLYAKQHKYAQAEQVFQRALGVMVAALGPDHPDVAVIIKNIGILKASKKEYAEADLLLKQSLLLTTRTLGQEHPIVALTMRTIAVCQAIQGHYEEAERVIRQSLEIGENTLGSEHPEVAASLKVFTRVLRTVHRDTEARHAETRAQHICAGSAVTRERM